MNFVLAAEGAALLFLLFRFTIQKSYLAIALPDKTVRLWLFIAAAALAARGLFAAGEEQALYLAGGVLCALATLLRGGVTARGFTGLRGGSCPWVKVRSVQMTEGEKNLALTCNSLTGAFTLSFALSQKEPLLKALDTYCKKQK